MGCDIHAVVELHAKNGVWHSYHTPSIGRDYALFGRMAGVRSTQHEPIAAPRGVPPCPVSLVTAVLLQKWKHDGHTHSWLTIDEMDQIEMFAKDVCGYQPWSPIFGYCFGNGWRRESLPHPFDDARLIFFFDN
jgi:hypothetical protein